MPFMGFKNFDDCVAKQIKDGKSKESALKICGALQKKAEGEITEDQYAKILAEIWLKEIHEKK